MLARSRVHSFCPAETMSPASTYTAVHLALLATKTELSLSETTLPETLFSVEMVSAVTGWTWTATPVGVSSALLEESLLLPQAVRDRAMAAARARDRMRF